MPDSIEAVLAAAENPAYVRVATVKVLLRQDLIARHEQLDADLRAAMDADGRLNRQPQAYAISEQVTELEAEIEAAKVEFRFRALSKRAWADLIALHPPTKDQTRVHAGLDHNPETFPIAAIAASCADPEMSSEQAQRLEQSLNHSQFQALWSKCLEANLGGLDTPKSLAAGILHRPNGASARQPTTTGSPEVSSLAG